MAKVIGNYKPDGFSMDEVHDLIERRIGDLDRRRDSSLSAKLDAIEKLLSMNISVRTEALSIALSKIETTNEKCFARCTNQVNTFYTIINKQSLDISLINQILNETVKKALDSIDEELYDEENGIIFRINSLEKWKTSDWKKALLGSVVVIVACTQVLIWIWDKLHLLGVHP